MFFFGDNLAFRMRLCEIVRDCARRVDATGRVDSQLRGSADVSSPELHISALAVGGGPSAPTDRTLATCEMCIVARHQLELSIIIRDSI